MAISDISSLRQHLQWAIEVEHATIPPYLFALYSIKEGKNREAAEILRSIFMEEMLHMTLAANILNAVGGSPKFDKPDFIPQYPSYLPYSSKSFLVPLAGFSRETVRTLMRIERPEEAGAAAEDEAYETIGQFYRSIEEGLAYLCEELGEEALFSGDSQHQVDDGGTVYAGSGRIVPVTGLESALAAINEIMHQGEGFNFDTVWDGDHNMFHHEREEVGHYFRLHELLEGRRYRKGDTPRSGPTGEQIDVDWGAVYKPANNPRLSDYDPKSEIGARMHMFSRRYREILQLLERGFNGEPECVARSVGSMYELRQDASELMQWPSGRGETTAGISFDYVADDPFDESFGIRILPDGPYAIQGDIPLVRKHILRSEGGEALAWSKDGDIETLPDYALCRCGASANKPFCDGNHAEAGFKGKETADTGPYEERCRSFESKGMTMRDDRPLCLHAGFCHNRVTDAWTLTKKTDDIQLRTQLIAMIEHCPSGALTYTLNSSGEKSVEPDLAKTIAVLPNGPLWVTGGIPIVQSDGVRLEVRNRVALCRCGASKNKPFCDGTHAEIFFRG